MAIYLLDSYFVSEHLVATYNLSSNPRISVTFFDKDGEQEIKVPVGMSMLEAAHENDIELEGCFFYFLHQH